MKEKIKVFLETLRLFAINFRCGQSMKYFHIASSKLEDLCLEEDNTEIIYHIIPTLFNALKHIMFFECKELNERKNDSSVEDRKHLMALSEFYMSLKSELEKNGYNDLYD